MRIVAALALVLALATLAAAYGLTTRGGGARPELAGVQAVDRCIALEQRRIQRLMRRERRRLMAAVRGAEATQTRRSARLARRSVNYALRQMREPGFAARAAAYRCSGATSVAVAR